MPHLSSMPLSFKCLLSDPDTSIRATRLVGAVALLPRYSFAGWAKRKGQS